MPLELASLAPQETITVPLTHPESKVAFTALLDGPYSARGLVATDRLLEVVGAPDKLKPEDDRTFSTEIAVSVLRGLPDVTVDGEPITVRDEAHARELFAAIPYAPGQIVRGFLKALGFFSGPSVTSSPTPGTSESSPA